MKLRILLAFCCVLAVHAGAGAEAPLADKLPAGTLAYVAWAGKTDALDKSSVGKMLQDPIVDSILKAVQDAAKANLRGEEHKIFQHAWAMGMTAVKRPIVVALTDLKFDPQGEKPPTFQVAALIDLGDQRADFAAHLDALIKLAGEDLKTEAAQTAGGAAYTKVLARGAPPMAFAYQGNVLVACIGTPPDSLLDLKAADSLAKSPAFRKYYTPLDGENVQMALYVDVAGIMKQVDPMLGPPAGGEPQDGRRRDPSPRTIISALGLSKVEALAGVARFVGPDIQSKGKLYTPAPHQGVLSLLAGGKLTKADVADVPADADFFLAFKLSPQKVYEELRRVLHEIEPRAEKEMLDGIGQMEKDLKISLEKDVLANLGDTWVLSSAASQGGFLTGTALTVTIKDGRKFSGVVQKIEDAMMQHMRPTPPPAPEGEPPPRPRGRRGPQIEKVVIDGVKISYVSFPGQPIPVAPAWAVHKDKLYVALWPQVVAAAAGARAESITANPAFARLWGQIGQGASIVSYCDLGGMLKKIYNLGLLGWTALANAMVRELDMEIKPDWLPLMEQLGKYLRPGMSSITAEEDGITCQSVSSLPPAGVTMVPLFGAGWLTFQSATIAKKSAIEEAVRAEPTGRARAAEVRKGRQP